MARHGLSVLAAALAVSGALLSISPALGQSNSNRGNTPQGRPFQHLQGQITALQQQLAAVQTQVNSIQQSVQQQINDILLRLTIAEGDIQSLRQRVQSVEDASALLASRIAANEQSIAALQAAMSALETQLGVLKGQVAQNTDDIALLDAAITSLRNIIDSYGVRITGLEEETGRIRDFQTTMANSSCTAGQAVQAVSPTGLLLCTSVSGGGGSGTLRTVRYTGLLGIPAGVGTSTEVSCGSPTELVTGGGYSRILAPEFELIPYVAAVASTPGGLVVTQGSLRHNPIYVVTDTPTSDPTKQSYQLHVRYLPNLPNMPAALFHVTAVCLRMQ